MEAEDEAIAKGLANIWFGKGKVVKLLAMTMTVAYLSIFYLHF
jgi:hypothetical protein